MCLVFCALVPVVQAKKDDFKDFKKVKPSKLAKTVVHNIDPEIPRTAFDKDIDLMIRKHLGDKYRRANVFDFYPMEIGPERKQGLNSRQVAELMDYYNYARRDLEKICKSKFLNVVKMDLNGDKDPDYSVLVRSLKTDKNMLAIFDSKGLIYLEPFNETFVEKVNDGNYPTTVVYGKSRRTINSPSLRLVAFDDESHILFYDLKKQAWELIGIGEQ